LGPIDDPLTIILNNKGQIINEEASRLIYEIKDNAFPWTTEAV